MAQLEFAPPDDTPGGQGPLAVPIHISVYDAQGEGALIEFTPNGSAKVGKGGKSGASWRLPYSAGIP